MQPVLKALIPLALIVGLIVGARVVIKSRADKARAEKQAAAVAKTNEAALAAGLAKTNTIEEVHRREEARRLGTNSSPAPSFSLRSGFHVSKTNMTEAANYMVRLAEALEAEEKVRQDNSIRDDEVRLKAEAKMEKELVPEVVRLLNEANEVLPVARAGELRQIIVPRMPPKIAELINNGIAPAVAPVQPAAGVAVSPVTHSPDEVSAYLLRLRGILTNVNWQLQSGKAFATQDGGRRMIEMQKRTVADLDRTIREITKSTWTVPQLFAFRIGLADESGQLNQARLTAGLPKEHLEVITAAFSSIFTYGHSTAAAPLATAAKNSPAEVEAKLLELLAEMKTRKERGLSLKEAGKEKTPEWYAAINELNALYGVEMNKILVNVAETGKSNWTAKELTEFLDKMRGPTGVEFGRLFDAKCVNGDPIIPTPSRQRMDTILAPLLRR